MWKFLDFYNADIDFWWIIFNETNKQNKQKKNSKSVIMSSNDVNKTAFFTDIRKEKSFVYLIHKYIYSFIYFHLFAYKKYNFSVW